MWLDHVGANDDGKCSCEKQNGGSKDVGKLFHTTPWMWETTVLSPSSYAVIGAQHSVYHGLASFLLALRGRLYGCLKFADVIQRRDAFLSENTTTVSLWQLQDLADIIEDMEQWEFNMLGLRACFTLACLAKF